jgi:arylsulfatase A-like enzyme
LWFFDLHTPWLSERKFDGPNPTRDHYDTELQYVSKELESLFAHMEQQGEYDESLIILTGDHGEIFDEHYRLPWSHCTTYAKKIPGLRQLFVGDGRLGHLSCPFFEELVHVPLYIKLPNSERGGKTVHGQVELIDILPTIADLADINPPETVEGESLLPKIEGQEFGKNYVRAEMGPNSADGFMRMIRGKEYKYINFNRPVIHDINDVWTGLPMYLSRRFFTPSEVLVKRNSEDENIIHSRPEIASGMKEELIEPAGGELAGEDSEISDEKRKELEDLGYL